MTTSSLNAPVLSEEEERRERESLTPEERKRLELDLFGTADFELDDESNAVVKDADESKAVIKEGLQLLDESIEVMTQNKKADYLEALERCPELVASESKPLFFLRCTDFDPRAAAERLVKYWTLRRKLFGDDDAFLPMSLSGQGALRADDVALLETGAFMILPPDKHGRIVLLFHPRKTYKFPNRSNRILRCLFYILTAAAKDNALLQRNGHVSLINFRDARLEMWDRRTSRRMLEILRCAPVAMKCAHLMMKPTSTSLFALIIPMLQYLMGKHIRLRSLFHAAGTELEAANALDQYGLDRTGVPSSLGGGWGAAQFEEWLNAQRRVDLNHQVADSAS